MANTVSINPMQTLSAGGMFSVQTEGYIQGFALDDPAIRNELATGSLLASESLPMWGGVAISEYLNAGANPNNNLGPNIGRAANNAGITGFAVFNQAHNWINTPQSPVPTAGSGMSVPFYRLGSGARVGVKCDPSLVAVLNSGLVSQQVSWDFNNQLLKLYDAATATVSLTSITASYSAITGLWTFAVVAAAATDVGAIGDYINISGVTATGGTAAITTLNKNQEVTAFTDNQHFSFTIAAAAGAYGAGAIAGTLVMNQGTGALNVKVLSIDQGNSMTVEYDPINNLAAWNRSETVAIIQI